MELCRRFWGFYEGVLVWYDFRELGRWGCGGIIFFLMGWLGYLWKFFIFKELFKG